MGGSPSPGLVRERRKLTRQFFAAAEDIGMTDIEELYHFTGIPKAALFRYRSGKAYPSKTAYVEDMQIATNLLIECKKMGRAKPNLPLKAYTGHAAEAAGSSGAALTSSVEVDVVERACFADGLQVQYVPGERLIVIFPNGMHLRVHLPRGPGTATILENQ